MAGANDIFQIPEVPGGFSTTGKHVMIHDLSQPEAASTYMVPATMIGVPGPMGPAGATLLTGTVNPLVGVGLNNDLYINTVTFELFRKVSGAWISQGVFKGTDGVDGTDSTVPGPAGASGGKWFNGAGAPSVGIGADNDYYINNTTLEYLEKVSGAWVSRGNFVGSTSVSGLVFNSVAELKAYTSLTPIANKTVDVLGYFSINDGGGGTFHYNPLNTLSDDGGINIKPTSVGAGAGAFERVFNGQDIETAYFGGVSGLQEIAVDVNSGALTITKKDLGKVDLLASPAGGSSNLHRFWGVVGLLEPGVSETSNLVQMTGNLSPNHPIGSVVEMFRSGAWVRMGVIRRYASGAGGVWGYNITNEGNFGDFGGGTLFPTRISAPVNSSFSSADIGKFLVIQDARLFTDFNTLPVGLNCKIASVNGSGVATLVNLDTGRGAPATTTAQTLNGNLINNAVMFMDATDGIAKAIKYCEDNGKDSPSLPAGTIGIMPYHSATWAAKPAFGTLPNTVEKSPFWFSKNVGLKGRGKGKSVLSVQYAVPNRTGVFNPNVSPGIHIFYCILFFCEPISVTKTKKYFNTFTVVFPKDLSVKQPYDCFKDYGNNGYQTPTRHGQEVFIDIDIKCENRNVSPFRSNYGDVYTYDYDAVVGYPYRGRYDAGYAYAGNDVYMDTFGNCYMLYFNGATLTPRIWHNKLLMKSGIYVNNCLLECAGFEIKHSELYGDPNKVVGKEFEVTDTKLIGGAIVHYRDFTGTYTKTGSEYFLEMVEKEYSPLLFNAHFYYSSMNVYNTPIEIKKRNTHTISNITLSGSNFIVTLSTNYADVTNANAKMWFNVGDRLTELYIDANPGTNGVSVTNGSPTVTVPVANAQRTLAEMQIYIGKTVRLYSRIDYVMLTDFGNNRKIKVGQWNTTPAGGVTYPVTETCLNELCDVIINATFREQAQGARGHPIYNHQNLNTKFTRFIVEDCPDVFRISDGSTNKPGLFTIKDSPQPETRGVAVRGTAFFTKYQIYYQCQGAVNIDNAGDFVNDFAVSGTIKNCKTLTGFPFFSGTIENCEIKNVSLAGGKIEVNKCILSSPISREGADIVVINSSGFLFVNAGKVLIKECTVGIQLYYDQGTPATRLPVTDVTYVDAVALSFINLSSLSAGEKDIARNVIKFIRTGLLAASNDGVGVVNGDFFNMSVKQGRYPQNITYNGSFTLSLPQAYPIAVINRTAMSIPTTGSGRILFLDSGAADEYLIGATTIDEIRFSNYFNGLSSDFNLFAQKKFRSGISIILIPFEAGFITNTTSELIPLTNASRAVGVPIRFVYDKVNSLWYEVANPFYN